MAMNVEAFHDDDGKTVVESRIHGITKSGNSDKVFAVLSVGNTDAKVLHFLYDLNTIEKMQLALASLAHELRETHDWRSDSDYVENYYSAADVRPETDAAPVSGPAQDWEAQMDYADGPPF